MTLTDDSVTDDGVIASDIVIEDIVRTGDGESCTCPETGIVTDDGVIAGDIVLYRSRESNGNPKQLNANDGSLFNTVTTHEVSALNLCNKRDAPDNNISTVACEGRWKRGLDRRGRAHRRRQK